MERFNSRLVYAHEELREFLRMLPSWADTRSSRRSHWGSQDGIEAYWNG